MNSTASIIHKAQELSQPKNPILSIKEPYISLKDFNNHVDLKSYANPSIANLELILLNLRTRSLEPSLLNMQGNKDSAFTILSFLGTVQSEISSYLYNLGMNSKINNEAKLDQINNFFMNLGNSNTFNPFLFPHLHVNNNSNIFSKSFRFLLVFLINLFFICNFMIFL